MDPATQALIQATVPGVAVYQQGMMFTGGPVAVASQPKGKGKGKPEDNTVFVRLRTASYASEASEEDLKEYFGRFGPIASIEVKRDHYTGISRGFAFVKWVSTESKYQALTDTEHVIGADKKVEIQDARFGGKPECGRSYRGPHESEKDDIVFIGGLPKELVTEADLKMYFSTYGEIRKLWFKTDQRTGKSRGFAFIQYADLESVAKVTAQRNHTLHGKWVDVEIYRNTKREEMMAANAASGFKDGAGAALRRQNPRIAGIFEPEPVPDDCGPTLFLGGLPKEDISEEDILEYFSKFGEVKEAILKYDADGYMRGFGFVTFEDQITAKLVLQSVRTHSINNRYVDVKMYGDQRRKAQEDGVPKSKSGTNLQPGGTKVFVGGIPDHASEEDFRGHFEKYGPLVEGRIKKEAGGGSRGFGFVEFQNSEDCEKCMRTSHELCGKWIDVRAYEQEKRKGKGKGMMGQGMPGMAVMNPDGGVHPMGGQMQCMAVPDGAGGVQYVQCMPLMPGMQPFMPGMQGMPGMPGQAEMFGQMMMPQQATPALVDGSVGGGGGDLEEVTPMGSANPGVPQMPNQMPFMQPPPGQLDMQQFGQQMPGHQMPPQQMPGHQMPPQQMPGHQMPPPHMQGHQMPPPHMQGQHMPPPHMPPPQFADFGQPHLGKGPPPQHGGNVVYAPPSQAGQYAPQPNQFGDPRAAPY